MAALVLLLVLAAILWIVEKIEDALRGGPRPKVSPDGAPTGCSGSTWLLFWAAVVVLGIFLT